jgi:hypothetical protein
VKKLQKGEGTLEKIVLVLGDIGTNKDDVVTVYPDNIRRILEANRDVPTINLAGCSASQLLDFLSEVEQNAIDTHINSSMEKG